MYVADVPHHLRTRARASRPRHTNRSSRPHYGHPRRLSTTPNASPHNRPTNNPRPPRRQHIIHPPPPQLHHRRLIEIKSLRDTVVASQIYIMTQLNKNKVVNATKWSAFTEIVAKLVAPVSNNVFLEVDLI